MKAMALLPAVAAAILALSVSAASSQQQTCMKEFQACMDGCTNKTAKAIQSSCFQGCEGKNTMCSEKIYGKRPFNGAPSAASAAAEPKDAPQEALARTQRQAIDARDQAPKQATPEPQRPRQPEQMPARR
jgi:hypothetical protein